MLAFLGLLLGTAAWAKAPELKIVRGNRADTVRQTDLVVTGVTEPGNTVTVGGKPVKVYKTGAFGAEVELKEGANAIEVTAVDSKGKKTTEQLKVVYARPLPATSTTEFSIDSVTLLPKGKKLLLAPGDLLRVKVKALPGGRMTWLGGLPLYELPAEENGGRTGFYQGQYRVKENDPRLASPLTIRLEKGGRSVEKAVGTEIGLLSPERPLLVRTKPGAYLNYGLGEDRLGGAKINSLPEGIRMEVAGQTDRMYKVKLGESRTAYIPAYCVEELPEGHFVPVSLTQNWRVKPVEKGDLVTVALEEKLPFIAYQETDPSRIVVDIYGARCNSNWITQFPGLKAVRAVDFRQVGSDVLRVVVYLQKEQPWGYEVSYEGTTLQIRVKERPAEGLKGMVIGVDAGHGGKASGAVSTTGYKEKDFNLDLARRFQKAMEERGATVVMTRTDDSAVDMDVRKKILSDADIDLLVSFHNNAGGNPLETRGTSTYYRHIGYRPLSTAILKRLLDLGLENFGNVGNFNFTMLAPTEYPNVLVEGLFMSNLEDEELLADPAFRQRMVDQVVLGLEDFLREQR